MPNENPGAYNEARNRIKENQEREKDIIETKKYEFEIKKEKIHRKKHLDVFSLKRSLETGQSLSVLKEDIKNALETGDVSIDTYKNVLDTIDRKDDKNTSIVQPDYVLDPSIFPFSQTELNQFFEKQILGENIFIDFGGFLYGFAQGSTLIFYLLGKIIVDTLLLPKDIYTLIRSK